MSILDRYRPEGREKIDFARVTFLVVAHILAIISLFNFSWQGLIAFLVLYAVTGMGITFGYHRLFTHRSFKVPKLLEVLSALAGTLAMQGNVMRWVAHHRMHHAFSDEGQDPHNSNRGFWYSHILWVCYANPERDRPEELRRFARDIAADKTLRMISSDGFMIALQAALCAFLWAVWGWQVMLWGVWLRMVAVYHATWLVNSAAHKWGYRNYKDGDRATNCWWVGLLTFGEGWHNNHHAHSNVAPAGRQWWELDVTWLLIKSLRSLGLATDVKTPPPLALDPNSIRPARRSA
ncbi:MAG TPA: fatty acid desaturase [Oligoflexus sp.]|uniref:acyl-CoA desaturase n=1 Tax=Oligoflexus sp. TaxID=1971216 RepID=UPI002D5B1445|nr:fatty acid desaturase [Oligoflexus sp.]HYX33953.1 fatty acid desaturase [Oligoflexus sp.]